jgi:hypothetical protein
MSDVLDLDDLLPRLRQRAADPERRTDVRQSELGATVRTLWVGSKTAAEQSAELMARYMSSDAQVQMARDARANIAKLSPEERAKMGLPEVGWERVVWGGLGWEEGDETGGSSG